MKECLECGIIFSDDLIQPFISTKGNTYCCPICALEIKNKIHGLNDTEFTGENANKLLKRARKFIVKLKGN